MKLKRKKTANILCGFLFYIILSLDSSTAQDITKFVLSEDSMRKIAPLILNGKTEDVRIEANQKFRTLLYKSLSDPLSYDYPFDSLKTIARLYSADGKVRIFNWNLPLGDGTFQYFGYIQLKGKKSKGNQKIIVLELKDKSGDIKNPEQYSGDPSNWFGAHYYKLIDPQKKRFRLGRGARGSYYTLLGIDWNDKITNKKIIEILVIQPNGLIKFGGNIFEGSEKKNIRRVIFEYSDQAVMSLKYDDAQNMIVFDHLSPSSSALQGQYQYYGPDFSFDGYKWAKGKWLYIKDLDARNEKDDERGRKYNSPK